MLAKAVADVPDPDSVKGGLRYEPKWDGFRGIVTIDGDDVEIGSRGAKPLTRYFPELVEAFRAQFGGRDHPVVLDGEVILRSGEPGARAPRLGGAVAAHPPGGLADREAQRRDAGAVRGVRPAGGRRRGAPRPAVRRAARAPGSSSADGMTDPLFVTRTTLDVEQAREWLTTFEGAGLDGVVAKPRARPYEPGKRSMLKMKHHRTADVVAIGYRVHKSGCGVGSLLVGLYGDGRRAPPGRRRLRLLRQAPGSR